MARNWAIGERPTLSELDQFLWQEQVKAMQAQQVQQPQQVAGSGGPLEQAAGLGGEAAGAYTIDSLIAAEPVSGIGPVANGADYAAGLGEIVGPMQGTTGVGPLASGEAYAAALEGTTPGMFSLSGIGSAGNVLLPAAGAIGAYDLFSNKRHGGRGALQGAASGAAMGSYFGPVGIGIGAGIGAGVGYFGNLGDKDRFKEEYGRAQALRDSGLNWGFNMNEPTKGRSIGELVAEAEAAGRDPTFARTRDESALEAVDTAGYAAWGEKYGKTYADAPLEKKIAVNKLALDKKALREHHGQIDFNSNLDSELDKLIKQTLEGK